MKCSGALGVFKNHKGAAAKKEAASFICGTLLWRFVDIVLHGPICHSIFFKSYHNNASLVITIMRHL